MALFRELEKNKLLPEPEDRKVEKIQHATSKRRFKRRKSSVSLDTVRRTLTVLSIIGGIAIVSGLIYVVYLGVNLYING